MPYNRLKEKGGARDAAKNSFTFVVPMLIVLGILGVVVHYYGSALNIYLLPPSSERYGRVILDRVEQRGLYSQGRQWQIIRQRSEKS